MEKFFDELKHSQQKSYLGKGSKLVTYRTDQYELKQFSMKRHGEIQITSVWGIAVYKYTRPVIFSSIRDWYERGILLQNLIRNAQSQE